MNGGNERWISNGPGIRLERAHTFSHGKLATDSGTDSGTELRMESSHSNGKDFSLNSNPADGLLANQVVGDESGWKPSALKPHVVH